MPGPADIAVDATDAPLPIAARRHPLVARVDHRLRTRCRVPIGATVVIGASGGADSSALLLAAAAMAEHVEHGRPSLVPVAAHVHHHLRDSADDDASWVQSLCRRLRIELRVEHVEPAAEPGNLAAAARRLRYQALARVARDAGAAHVAVAHHAEDQLETMLIALCRGAGLDGLAGMAWSRDLAPGRQLVRPLLDCRRAECEDICRAAGIDWRVDPSNDDPAAARTRLRCDVLPVLESLWPGAAARVAATSDVVQVARDLLDKRVQQAFGAPGRREWNRADLAALPVPIIAAGLRRAAVEGQGADGDALGQSHLRAAAEAIRDEERRPREFHWAGGLVLRVTSDRVEL